MASPAEVAAVAIDGGGGNRERCEYMIIILRIYIWWSVFERLQPALDFKLVCWHRRWAPFSGCTTACALEPPTGIVCHGLDPRSPCDPQGLIPPIFNHILLTLIRGMSIITDHDVLPLFSFISSVEVSASAHVVLSPDTGGTRQSTCSCFVC